MSATGTSDVALAGFAAASTGVGGVDSAVTGVSGSAFAPIAATSVGVFGGTSVVSRQNITASTAAGVTGVSTTVFQIPQVLELIQAASAGFTPSYSVAILQAITAQSTGVVGAVGTSGAQVQGVAGAQVQGVVAEGYGGESATGTSVMVLQGITAVSRGHLGTGATFSAVVVQTESYAVNTYTNYQFNSFARFNGAILAAGDGGLYKLEGATDDGTEIQAAIRWGTSDLKTPFRKRVDSIYLGGKFAGNMVLRIRTDGATVRDYRVRRTSHTDMHGVRVKLGQGVEARYWQFELRNEAGSAFDFDIMELKPVRLNRRVGGKDA